MGGTDDVGCIILLVNFYELVLLCDIPLQKWLYQYYQTISNDLKDHSSPFVFRCMFRTLQGGALTETLNLTTLLKF